MSDKEHKPGPADTAIMRVQLKTLREMEEMIYWHNRQPSLYLLLAMISVTVWVSVMQTDIVSTHWDNSYAFILDGVIGLAVTVPVAYVMFFAMSLNTPFLEKVDKALAQYEPLDAVALADLQEKLREPGKGAHYEILAWAQDEKDRVRHQIDLLNDDHPKRFKRFLSRQIQVNRPAA